MKQPSYPGTPSTADGSGAIVYVETAISEAATAYPITPTTNMGAGYQEKVSNGAKNLWGTPLAFVELESEHSAATACEGFAVAGGRVANFTSGQGLILMKEVLYTISGKRLPVVFNIGARALTSHSLNVHGGHDDIYGVMDVGWGCLFARNVQESLDLALIARRAAEATLTPFFNVQDGFLTTHTVESVMLPEAELMKTFVGDPREKLRDLFDPAKGLMVGVVQNQESYMKGKVAQRLFYDRVRAAVVESMALYRDLTGREYGLVDSYRMEDAEYAIVGLGTAMETAKVAVDYAREKYGWKVGLVHPTCVRPFPAAEIVQALRACKGFSVIERLDEPLAESNPLTREIKSAFADSLQQKQGKVPHLMMIPEIYSGVYGMGGRDFRIEDALAVFRNMVEGKREKPFFACGVSGDWALGAEEPVRAAAKGAFAMRGHSVGGYGSVTTNKIIATLCSELFGLKVQAFPKYGSEKKGLPTTFYLTVAEEPILTHCELNNVDFVPVLDSYAFKTGNPLAGLDQGGVLFLQSPHPEADKVWGALPPAAQRTIAVKGIRVLYMDMVSGAMQFAPTPDLQQRMQGILLLGTYLKVAPFAKGMDNVKLFEKLRVVLGKYFGRRGDDVIEANLKAAQHGFEAVHEVPANLIQGALASTGGKS
jgi:pyruvate-ferredoxin/flavodoxin oxidoreductase